MYNTDVSKAQLLRIVPRQWKHRTTAVLALCAVFPAFLFGGPGTACPAVLSLERAANEAADIVKSGNRLAAVTTCYRPYAADAAFQQHFDDAELRVRERFYFEYAVAAHGAAKLINSHETQQKLLVEAAENYRNYTRWFQKLPADKQSELESRGRDRSKDAARFLGDIYTALEEWNKVLENYEVFSRGSGQVFDVVSINHWYQALIRTAQFSPYSLLGQIQPKIFRLRFQIDPTYERRWKIFSEAITKCNNSVDKSTELEGVLKQLSDFADKIFQV